jgi:hypothetical protein
LISFGVLISGATFWQQSRSRHAHSVEVTALNTTVAAVRTDLANLSSQEKIEVARREQAEKDLMLGMAATRQGVAEDIRKTPLHVEVKGQSPQEIESKKRARDGLGKLLQKNQLIRTSCQHPELLPEVAHFSCFDSANSWLAEAYEFISKNMESSYAARFLSATGYAMSYDGVTDKNTENAMTTLQHKATALTEFIKEKE